MLTILENMKTVKLVNSGLISESANIENFDRLSSKIDYIA